MINIYYIGYDGKYFLKFMYECYISRLLYLIPFKMYSKKKKIEVARFTGNMVPQVQVLSKRSKKWRLQAHDAC